MPGPIIQRAMLDADRYRRLVELAPDAMVMVSDGKVLFANPAFVRLIGAAGIEEVLGLPMSRCLDLPMLKAVRSEIVGAPLESAENTAEETLRRLDGSTRIVEVAAVPLMHAGEPAVQMFLRDVTQRRAAVDARREGETRLSLLLEQTPALFWTTDTSLLLTSAGGGGALAARFGGAIGRSVLELFDPAGLADVEAAHRLGLSGRRATLALAWGGRAFELRVDGLRVADGTIAGTVGVALDVTERRQIEDLAQDAAQLDALTRIAAGVAHEMNNVLAAIAGLAAGLELDHTLLAEQRVSVEGILASTARGRDLVSNLLGFARGGRYRLERFDLNGVVRGAAAWLAQRSGGISAHLALAVDLPLVEGDPIQVLAALENLLQNAVDASPDGGRVTLSTRWVTEHAGSLSSPDLVPAVYAVVEIADAGVGMTDEVRQRAVEPFFTTKGIGLGPGLGLSMAYGVARHHGGTLLLSSSPGHGTTVTVYLPAVAALLVTPPAPAPVVTLVAAPADKPRVLVIDDDLWVRFSTRRLLHGLGFDAVDADGGEAGLARFREAGGRFLFVLLDVRMPGMNGEDVLRHLLQIDPDVRVIIFTGFARDQVSQRIFQAGQVGFLGKPFTVPQLEAQMLAVGVGPLPTLDGPVPKLRWKS
ncbi:MAG: ATP-binding protein [Myxococcota bacterium]